MASSLSKTKFSNSVTSRSAASLTNSCTNESTDQKSVWPLFKGFEKGEDAKISDIRLGVRVEC